jgi:uncharacterized membrane protein YdjX (TVP38/TMEM64 family)
MTKETKKTIGKLLLGVLVVGAFLGGAYLAAHLLGWTDMTEEGLEEMIASTGAIAPLVYILISFVQVTFIPIPAAVTIVAGSYLFGIWEAFLYSYIGMMLGAMLAFGLGRWFGRPFVDWVTGGKEKTDEWIAKLKGRENVLLFFMFFFPVFPDDILCTVAGILPISWLGFFLMQFFTRITSIGATLLFMSGQIIPFSGWGLLLLGGVALIGIAAFVVCMKYADKINVQFLKFADKIIQFFKKNP